VECLDNIPCHVWDIDDFSIHRGAAVALLVGELQSVCGLWVVIDPLLSLLDDELVDILEGYDEVASHL
jgi:hypothetical protein